MKTLKIIAILYMFSITFLGASDALLKNRESESKIVDIGYTHPKSSYSSTRPKELVSSIPLEQFVDNLLDQKGRVLSEKYDCEIDYLGRENCPLQSSMCQGQEEFEPGLSTKIESTTYKPKIGVSVRRENSLNSNLLKGDYQLAPTNGTITVNSFSLSYNSLASEGRLPSPRTLYNDGYNNNGKFAMKMFNIGSGCGGLSISPVPDSITVLVNGGSSVRKQPYRGDCNHLISSGNLKYATILAEWNNMPSSLSYHCDDYCLIGKPSDGAFGFWNYSCPSTYVDSDGIFTDQGFCKKEYSYYKYSCQEGINQYDLPWVGPEIDAGGDCEGNCGPYGCSCNSEAPPENNCGRDNYLCPSDPDQLCSITTEDDGLEQESNHSMYLNGDSETFDKEIITEKACPNNETWDAISDECVTNVVLRCTAENSYYNENLNRCVAFVNTHGATPSNSFCPSGYSITTNLEAITRETVSGSVLANSQNANSSFSCVAADIPYCENGTYDSSIDACDSVPICDIGVFDIHEKRCVIPVTCLDGLSYSSESENCERPLETKIMKCPQSNDIYEEGNPDVCKTSPVIATARYDGQFLGHWWHCDTCFGSDSVKNAFLEGIAGAGGTTVTKTLSEIADVGYFRTYEITTNATSPYFIQFNGSDGGIVINPNDVIHWSPKKFLNTTTGESISSGGKPHFYVHSSIECSSWRTEPSTKDYPTHQVCNDPIGQYAYCPAGFQLTTDPSGGQLCYVPPTCQTGYTMSSNGLYCSINVMCEAGYTADYDNNICIKDRDDGSEVNLERDVYESEAECPYGELLTESGDCAIIPTCENGTAWSESLGQCVSSSVPNCINENAACIGNREYGCPNEYNYDSRTNECKANGYCEYGTRLSPEGCVKEYKYSAYSCPEGTEGPLMSSGDDCLGTCGEFGCSCNSVIPPANNCRRPFLVDDEEIVILNKRALVSHGVYGDLNPDEFGTHKGFSCGENCEFAVDKIVGNNSSLCFVTANNRKSCISISDCSFRGTIENNSSNMITELVVRDPHTLTSPSSSSSIYSTCRMNGHVGWAGRTNGILSVGVDEETYSRLSFWDSYIDKDIGFIEFPPEVGEDDRADGFMVEDPLPYEMSEKNFTTIDKIGGKTYYAGNVSGSICTGVAELKELTRVSTSQSSSDVQRLAGDSTCVLYNDGDHSFAAVKNAIREDIRTNTRIAYKCSPLTCEGHSCQTADCPIAEEGDQYLGTLLAPGEYIEEEECIDQSCDAYQPYYGYCARKLGCDTARDSLVFETENGQCKSLYCEEGSIMNLETQQCESLSCPDGYREDLSGRCVVRD